MANHIIDKFTYDGETYILQDNQSGYITDAGVTSFNGSTGAVTYTAPVTSVNGNTGAVTVSVPTASTTTPLMDGTASYGSGTSYARSNHVHPSDTSKLNINNTATVDNINYTSNINHNNNIIVDDYSMGSGLQEISAATIDNIDYTSRRIIVPNEIYDYVTYDAPDSIGGIQGGVISNSLDINDAGAGISAQVYNGTQYLSSYVSAQSDGTIVITANTTNNTNQMSMSPTTTEIHNVVTPRNNGDAVPLGYLNTRLNEISQSITGTYSYTTTITPNGTTSSYTINHNLNTYNTIVSVGLFTGGTADSGTLETVPQGVFTSNNSLIYTVKQTSKNASVLTFNKNIPSGSPLRVNIIAAESYVNLSNAVTKSYVDSIVADLTDINAIVQ